MNGRLCLCTLISRSRLIGGLHVVTLLCVLCEVASAIVLLIFCYSLIVTLRLRTRKMIYIRILRFCYSRLKECFKLFVHGFLLRRQDALQSFFFCRSYFWKHSFCDAVNDLLGYFLKSFIERNFFGRSHF